MTAAANLWVGWQLLPACGLGGSCRTRAVGAAATMAAAYIWACAVMPTAARMQTMLPKLCMFINRTRTVDLIASLPF